MSRIFEHKKRIFLIGGIIIAAIIGILFFVSTEGLDSSAAHMNYFAEDSYGKGNYVYSTVTFTGSGLTKDTVLSVKNIEQLAYNKDLHLGYENEYSLLTSGSVFSTKKFTGIKLYDLLLYLGLDENLDEDTPVTVVSADGYTVAFTIDQLKSDDYGRFDSMSATKASEDNLPVLLSFGSDGVPLVGPTGSEAVDKTISKKEGFNKSADNVGGPIRLTVGQKESGEYNAPLNAKWVAKIIVGRKSQNNIHTGEGKNAKALQVILHNTSSKTDSTTETQYTLGDIEDFAVSDLNRMDRNYYGSKNFFEGADLWRFLRYEAGVTAQEGSVKFTFSTGGTETLSLGYLRNLNGDYENYITQKGKLQVTCIKPALGYAINGHATKDFRLYALLPADGKEKSAATVKEIKSIDVYCGNSWFDEENRYSTTKLSFSGRGMKEDTSVTIGDLENQIDLMTTSGDYMGVSLLGLLENLGLSVDASKITVSNGEKQVTFTVDELQDAKKETILATRISGTAIDKEQGPVVLKGLQNLNHVTSITIGIKKGQWTHAKKEYQTYLDTTLKISGSQAKTTRTYTLKQLENLEETYTVKDYFAAGGGGNSYQGVFLRKLVMDNLKNGLKMPDKITVIGKDGYEVELAVKDVLSGVESTYQPGETRDIILAYSVDGTPLVPSKKSQGYTGENAFGPLRLIVENQTAKWVKNVAEIRLGN